MRLLLAAGAAGRQHPYRMGGSDEWRIICPCQHHGTRSRLLRSLRSLSPWTRRLGTIAVGAPLVFGVVQVPALVSVDAARTRAEASVTPENVEQQFTLITEEVKQEFLPIDAATEHRRIEVAHEEFFRSRVPYGSIIYREAHRNGLPPDLVAAVVEAESDFRASLVSDKNAQGLMQIIPSTGELMGATDLMNPSENVRAGTRYLSYLFRRYGGDQQKVLAAYNAGEGAVARFGGIPPFPETVGYLARVAASRKALQQRLRAHTEASVR